MNTIHVQRHPRETLRQHLVRKRGPVIIHPDEIDGTPGLVAVDLSRPGCMAQGWTVAAVLEDLRLAQTDYDQAVCGNRNEDMDDVARIPLGALVVLQDDEWPEQVHQEVWKVVGILADGRLVVRNGQRREFVRPATSVVVLDIKEWYD